MEKSYDIWPQKFDSFSKCGNCLGKEQTLHGRYFEE
jgi:hypothetical protein